MHIFTHAAETPDKPALIFPSETVSFKQLEDRSNQYAQFWRSLGIGPGGTIALFMENDPRYFEIAFSAARAGLYFTCISSRLTAPEVEYILTDSGSSVVMVTPGLADVAKEIKQITELDRYFVVSGEVDGYERLEPLVDEMPTARISDEMMGAPMLYSSGTTGRPKGIRRPLEHGQPIDEENALQVLSGVFAAMTSDSIYLSPAPLYHAAPLNWTLAALGMGVTIVCMVKFDAEEYLQLVEKHKVTHSQLVPTMFVRMLKLPEEVRQKYDVSSMQMAIHAAAPCPIPVKKQMIEWWGKVISEYYAGSEGNGFCWINSEEWLAHEGSVGKCILGEAHICNDDGDELPPREPGTIYFSGMPPPTYHNDPEKTKSVLNPKHDDWSTLGDVGYMDEEGYVYLTDRKSFMIISGGVNIYPQEAENVLITHPKVTDVAVIGVPNEDFGEEVKAVVQPANMAEAGPELEAELIEYCMQELTKIKCPKTIDFDPELPRHPTGKLYKRLIRDRYWGKKDSKIV